MKTIVCLFAILSVAGAALGAERAAETREQERPVPVVHGEGAILTSTSSPGLAARETAGPDTFVLYGGPGDPVEGKFQLSNAVTPDWGNGTGSGYTGAPAQWRPVDLTDLPVFWHRSQFNAQELGTDQPSPNHAMWCGVESGDPLSEGWRTAPGYGNTWRDRMTYESASVSDPAAGQTVFLDFFFHHDTEPGYDYFVVEYDSAGNWIEVFSIDGTDADSLGFHVPGVQFSTVQTGVINYAGNDYGGVFGDLIAIRMVVTSDGAWSDEDGLWPTQAGAVQVDDITLTTSEGTFNEEFEGAGPYLFTPNKAPFVGDFAEVYPFMTDLDPCFDNTTPLMGFVDTGQIIRNGPGIDGTTHITGGSLSTGVNYGTPGNYVVNYSGGLSFGETDLYNEIWSPEILWDVPGSDDNDIAVSGARFRHTAWLHLPLVNGMFYVWGVRSAQPADDWSNWQDYSFVYYGGGVPQWWNYDYDVTGLLEPNPERVQLALGVLDYASVFAFPGTAATPSPFFDNVTFLKYRIGGPSISTRTIDTAQDGFPVGGSIDVSTSSSRDALDIPFSMARDVSSGDLMNVPGDSITVIVTPVIPGTTVTDIRMFWALETNDLFEDALRTAPSSLRDVNVVAGAAGTVWTGEVVADSSTTSAGALISERYFFDLPDQDFMYPGDVLHYYIQATDSDGRASTLPANTDGFLDFSYHTLFSRTFTVRGLPSIRNDTGDQPELLVWNDFGRRGGEDEWLSVFYGRGLVEGEDYDSYTTQGPSSGVSNGLGSAGAHGANADQLSAYEHIVYLSGNLSTYLLSNGTNSGNNDKSDDIGLLEQWHALPGTRNVVYFGDYIATGLSSDSGEGASYLAVTMGVNFGDPDVRDVIGDQVTPIVVPNAGGTYEMWFDTDYVAFGGCPGINQFDQIQPGPGADAGHLFTDPSGVPYPPHPDPAFGGVASVINPTANGLDVTLPYGFHFIYNAVSRGVDDAARGALLVEVLWLFQYPFPIPNDAPPEVVPVRLSVYPNPFNPATTISFTALAGSQGSVKVYNVRGELVRTLHSGEFQTQEFRWDGADQRGKAVASGVYVVKAATGETQHTKKIALVR